MGQPKELLFIDASVFFAAAASPTGGSSLVLEICTGRRYAAVCSPKVIQEAQRNIRLKLTDDELVRFYHLLARLSPALAPPVSEAAEAPYRPLVTAKDSHVIAAAVQGQAHFLISLDRKHLVNDKVRAAGLPFQVMTPGEFLQAVVRAHSAG
jgi:predicted nucleic acid-binding protein